MQIRILLDIISINCAMIVSDLICFNSIIIMLDLAAGLLGVGASILTMSNNA